MDRSTAVQRLRASFGACAPLVSNCAFRTGSGRTEADPQRTFQGPLETIADSVHVGSVARYFFHLHRCDETALDEEGVDCPNIKVVRETAVQKIRDVLCDDIPHGRLRLDSSILVEDEQGQEVMAIPFGDAFYDIKT